MAINKLASVLHNLAVKRASELFVDAFITKVAAALPITKRAAFRTMQTQLATGDSLPDAIKVAFPKLDAVQRHALAINICKCAIDEANKMTQRSPESYTVPAKDAAKTMREKCSENKPTSNLGPTPNREYDLPKQDNPLAPPQKANLGPTPDRKYDLPKQDNPLAPPQKANLGPTPDRKYDLPKQDNPLEPPQTAGFNYMDYLKNPYVLGGLSLGVGGLGAYGLYNLMKKRRRRPVEELD